MSNMIFANNIYELRKQNNLTQEQMAELCNVTRQAVAKWESGEGTTKINNIEVICKKFNVKSDELLFGTVKVNDNTQEKEDKLDKILDILKTMKTTNLYEAFKSKAYESDEDIDYRSYGDEAYDNGDLTQALKMYDLAAGCGDINGIISAIDLRREVLDLLDDDNSLYCKELNRFASKLIEYGSILTDVLKRGELI